MENEMLLDDRLMVIKQAYDKYDLEHTAYLSFSGGKDSTILHRLIDMAVPGNRIPRVFFDTGIEYKSVRKFVLGIAEGKIPFKISDSCCLELKKKTAKAYVGKDEEN